MAKRPSRVRAVILTVCDTGVALSAPVLNAAGACLRYETESFGQVCRGLEVISWIQTASRLAKDYELPLVVVDSSWFHAFIRERTDGRLVLVHVNYEVWRPELFGRSKLLDEGFAEKHLSAPSFLAHDVAQALCLRAWAERSSEVRKAVAAAQERKRRAA